MHPSQLAIAWLRAASPLTIPVIGARTLAQVQDNLGAVDVGFPMAFLRAGRSGLFGRHLDARVRPAARAAYGIPAA